MCLIVDVNTFPNVFSGNDKDFAPVKDWILKSSGKMIIGGTKYREEIAKLPKYARPLAELLKANKIVKIDDEIVDQREGVIQKLSASGDFDDQHLVALADESCCKVICSLDRRADRFIRDKKFYAKSPSVPSIYRSKSHVKLLCDKNIVAKCK